MRNKHHWCVSHSIDIHWKYGTNMIMIKFVGVCTTILCKTLGIRPVLYLLHEARPERAMLCATWRGNVHPRKMSSGTPAIEQIECI